jgi:hypothetical protein
MAVEAHIMTRLDNVAVEAAAAEKRRSGRCCCRSSRGRLYNMVGRPAAAGAVGAGSSGSVEKVRIVL